MVGKCWDGMCWREMPNLGLPLLAWGKAWQQAQLIYHFHPSNLTSTTQIFNPFLGV